MYQSTTSVQRRSFQIDIEGFFDSLLKAVYPLKGAMGDGHLL